MVDRRIAIVTRQSSEYISEKEIATAKEFLVCLRITFCDAIDPSLFVGRQFQTQPFDYPFGNRILQPKNIAGLCVDPITPQNVIRRNIEQLSRNPKTISSA